jgi:hypothetical protein
MIRRVMWPELKRARFRRARNRFSRWVGDGWEIIDFQASSWGSRDDVRFTINLGTALVALRQFTPWDEKNPPPESSAHLRERIGVLLAGRDVWWDVGPTTDVDAVAADMLRLLREIGIPWLDARCGLDRVLDLVSAQPEELGWHDLRMLPNLLREAGNAHAADAVLAEATRRGSP